MEAFQEKMKAAGLSEDAITAFKINYDQLVAGVTGMVPETDIKPVESLPRLDDVKRATTDKDKDLLSKTAILKLNGGLGTSMGLEKAKSLLEIKDGLTFLDLIAKQVVYMRTKFDSNLRFVLMNSFSTSEDTMKLLTEKYPDLAKEADLELVQNKSPKVDATSMAPATHEANPDMEWCPPGHGDIYPALSGSGMLKRLIESGVKYLFVSNSDNLGATMDVDLLAYFAEKDYAFMMEVADRTEGDKKGGHLCIRGSDGKYMLREQAMCPDDDKAAFEDITKHKYFNTNNLWINLEKLQKTITDAGGVLKLPLIKNSKTVNPRDKATPKVFQLETAMGSAIECFADAGAIVVPRSRFAPVKTCNDLFVLRSDAYKLTEEFTIVLAAEKAPLAKLDDDHYKLVDKMESLVVAPPSLIGCSKITVSGPIKFEKGVTIKGTVSIGNKGDSPASLEPGEYADVTLDMTAGVTAAV